jgi:hypothetical protein
MQNFSKRHTSTIPKGGSPEERRWVVPLLQQTMSMYDHSMPEKPLAQRLNTSLKQALTRS